MRATDAGEAFLAHARRALADLEAGQRAVRDVHELSSGVLRIGFTPTFVAHLVGPLVNRSRHLDYDCSWAANETRAPISRGDIAVDEQLEFRWRLNREVATARIGSQKPSRRPSPARADTRSTNAREAALR